MPLRPPAGFVSANYDPLKNSNPPTSPAASAGDQTASVSFTAPTNTGGGAITNYYAVSNPGQVVGSSVTSPIAVSGLTNNTQYTFKVWAENPYGPSAYSAPTDAVTPSAPVIEELFSTWLYSGNGSTQSIVNGINLSSNGGMTWLKCRNNANSHTIFDTARPVTQILSSNSTTVTTNSTGWGLTSFNSNGFSLNSTSNLAVNNSGENYVSWTFRKQAKFFDVVTYTGNGDNYRTINHSLGSTPGMVILKSTSDSAAAWAVWHRSVSPNNLILNSTSAAISGQYSIQDVTSSNFAVANSSFYGFPQSIPVNANGATYVAYLFAHDAGGFGTSGTDNVISCGSFTNNGSGAATVTLGYEPQWVMIKNRSAAENWQIADNLRGMFVGNTDAYLVPNTTATDNLYNYIEPTATGFKISGLNASQTYVYIAIRRGPMKTPTSGSTVFTALTRTGNNATAVTTGYGFAPDAMFSADRTGSYSPTNIYTRLRGQFFAYPSGAPRYVQTSSSNPEGNPGNEGGVQSFDNNGITFSADSSGRVNFTSTYVYWVFGRAPSVFDIVYYNGGTTNIPTTVTIGGQNFGRVTHNLGVAPELILIKNRTSSVDWMVGATVFGNGTYGRNASLNLTDGVSDGGYFPLYSEQTASYITVNNGVSQTGSSSNEYVAYLFASCAGVSKVGSYTGTGTTQQINCGFTAGARFVLIKRINSTGGWYVWDYARGIVAGNDPYILLNSTAAEVTNTDYIDAYSAGFEISSTAPAALNAVGGTYLYLAIA